MPGCCESPRARRGTAIDAVQPFVAQVALRTLLGLEPHRRRPRAVERRGRCPVGAGRSCPPGRRRRRPRSSARRANRRGEADDARRIARQRLARPAGARRDARSRSGSAAGRRSGPEAASIRAPSPRRGSSRAIARRNRKRRRRHRRRLSAMPGCARAAAGRSTPAAITSGSLPAMPSMPIGQVRRAMRSAAMPRSSSRWTELRALGLRADQAAEGEVAAAEDRLDDAQVERMLVGEDEEERARRRMPHLGLDRVDRDPADPRRPGEPGVVVAGNSSSRSSNQSTSTSSVASRVRDRPADVAGAVQLQVEQRRGRRASARAPAASSGAKRERRPRRRSTGRARGRARSARSCASGFAARAASRAPRRSPSARGGRRRSCRRLRARSPACACRARAAPSLRAARPRRRPPRGARRRPGAGGSRIARSITARHPPAPPSPRAGSPRSSPAPRSGGSSAMPARPPRPHRGSRRTPRTAAAAAARRSALLRWMLSATLRALPNSATSNTRRAVVGGRDLVGARRVRQRSRRRPSFGCQTSSSIVSQPMPWMKPPSTWPMSIAGLSERAGVVQHVGARAASIRR